MPGLGGRVGQKHLQQLLDGASIKVGLADAAPVDVERRRVSIPERQRNAPISVNEELKSELSLCRPSTSTIYDSYEHTGAPCDATQDLHMNCDSQYQP